MTITEQRWNQLSDEQKNFFQDEVGKKFKNGEYPSDNDILIFLGNNKQETGVNVLGDEEKPPAQIDLWEGVLTYFNSKK